MFAAVSVVALVLLIVIVHCCSAAVSSSATTLLGGWTLDHCNYDNDKDRVSFQIFLPLRNKQLLGEYSSYEPDDNTSTQADELLHRRLAKARSIFLPREDDFVAVERFLFDVKGIPRALCKRRNRDSIKCSNVQPQFAESIFDSPIRLCFYILNKSTANRPLRRRRRLLSETKPFFNCPLIETVSGLSPHAVPTHFGSTRSSSVNHKQDQEQEQQEQQQQQQVKSVGRDDDGYYGSSTNKDGFPIGSLSNSNPVILRITEEIFIDQNNVETFSILAVDMAFNCMDGTSSLFQNNAIVCTSGLNNNNNPTSVTIQLHDESGNNNNVLQGTCSILSSNCFAVGQNYGSQVSSSVAAAGACSIDTAGSFAGLVPFQRYSISATVNFGDSVGQSSSLTPILNYYNGNFYASPVTASGAKDSVVTPILTLSSKPSRVRSFYGVDDTEHVSASAPLVSQGVFEFAQLGEGASGYLASDLTAFLQQINSPASGSNNNNNGNGIPVHYVGSDTFQYLDSAESALDIELLMGIATNAPTVFWSVSISDANAPGQQGDFSTFVEAVANMFSAIANNETSADFPKQIPYPSGWSISYGLSEADAIAENEYLVNRADHYLQILSNAGIHVYVSSGDSGATVDDGSSSSAHFPAVLPHAVAVGATSFYRKPGVGAGGQLEPIQEVACSALDNNIITSGGAFSTAWAQPSYQQPYVASKFRGLPDVSALGANLFAWINGNRQSMFGTSASAPIFCAIMTLLNNRLVQNGNETLRSAHEFFYSQQSTSTTATASTAASTVGPGFNDITSGNNCGSRANNGLAQYNFPTLPAGQCYFASTGWDAVTGIGSPNFNNLFFALTGKTVPPNGPPTNSNGGTDFSSLAVVDFIEDHWKYFAIGGGALFSLIVGCCCYLKKKSLDKERASGAGAGAGGDDEEEQQRESRAFVVGAVVDYVPSRASPRSRTTARSARDIIYNNNKNYGSVNDTQSLSSRTGSGVRYVSV